MHYALGYKNEFSQQAIVSMHRLRADVFKTRKGWAIETIDGMDIDGYDALDPIYMLIKKASEDNDVHGCWRMLPTSGPYMLKHTFSELLHGQEAPCSETIWELSRFAINAEHYRVMNFSDITAEAIKTIIAFGFERELKSYVTVTTVGVERMLIRSGIHIQRFGPPLQIGVERAVALKILLSEQTRKAILQ
jgi:acyl homoserine lactone synthase